MRRIPVILLLALAGLLPAAGAAAAGFQGPGVPMAVTTVSGALNAADDTPCILEGRLTARIPHRKHRYVFEDGTGSVTVRIRPRVFGPQTVTPQHRIRIVGEVDWDDKHANEIDVEGLIILPPPMNAAHGRPAPFQPGLGGAPVPGIPVPTLE